MREEVLIRMEEARKAIDDAESSLAKGDYEGCCVSACYSIFHVVRALAVALEFNPKNLEDAVHLVCMHREEIGFSREDCARIYRAMDIKSEIDGGYLRRVTEDVAKKTLEDVRVIYEKALSFLSS